jgi:CelD/BcsL family acetyltransferase involved in cellulose biosynthesis
MRRKRRARVESVVLESLFAPIMVELSMTELAPFALVGRGLQASHSARRRATSGSSGDMLSGSAQIAAARPAWTALERRAGDAAVFQSHDFAVAAARYHEAKGEAVHVSLVYDGDRLRAALPIAVSCRWGVRAGRFLGDPVAQYGDALVAAGDVAAAQAALDQIAEAGLVDLLHFRRVRADAALSPVLANTARPLGQPLEAPFADLSQDASIDAMLLRIGGAKQRRERARSRRRLEEKGEVLLDVRRGAEALPVLAEAVAIKRDWLKERGLASAVLDDGEGVAALAATVDGGTDALVAMRLMVGGDAAAYEIGLICGRRYHAYLGAVVERFAGSSPGKVQMELALEWCRASGIDIYDLLAPSDEYKRQWSTGAMQVRDYVAPVTGVGRLYADLWLERLRPRLQKLVLSAPAPLRRAAMRAALGSTMSR